MKILFNTLNLEKGGAQRVISILANYFSLNNQVDILLFQNKKIKYELNNNIKIHSINKKRKENKFISQISIIKLFKMAFIINKIKPDIIISFLPEPSLKLMLIKKFNKRIKNIPTIISIRNDPKVEYKNKLIYIIMKYLYKNVDKLVLQTKEAYDYFINIFKANKLVNIPNPIDSKFFLKEPFIGKRKEEIVTVGKLEKQKNQKLLITTFSKITAKYPRLKLIIYGKGSLEEDLKNYVKDLNLEKKVFFKGEIDNLNQTLYQAKMFILTSDYEGMPNALMEAMALGVPCISTDCQGGGSKFLIQNNKNGLLVPINDRLKLEEAIIDLLENEDKSKKISQQALKDSQKFTVSNIAKIWEKEIKHVLKI